MRLCQARRANTTNRSSSIRDHARSRPAPEAGQLLQGLGETVGDAIVTDPRVAKSALRACAAVGRLILARAGIKKVTLELGNNSPLSLLPMRISNMRLNAVYSGAFAHSGQVCISVQTNLLRPIRARRIFQYLVAAADAMKVGDPMLETTDFGPMIAELEAQRIERLGE